MEIILVERVPNLGQMGDIGTVKGGCARNFLLPQGKALPATKANLAEFEDRRKELEAENKSRRDDAQKMAKTLESISIKVERQASEVGQLYGSVKPGDLQKAIVEMGHDVPKGSVQLAEPIKTIGEFEADVVLHPEVTVKVPVHVTRQVL